MAYVGGIYIDVYMQINKSDSLVLVEVFFVEWSILLLLWIIHTQIIKQCYRYNDQNICKKTPENNITHDSIINFWLINKIELKI